MHEIVKNAFGETVFSLIKCFFHSEFRICRRDGGKIVLLL